MPTAVECLPVVAGGGLGGALASVNDIYDGIAPRSGSEMGSGFVPAAYNGGNGGGFGGGSGGGGFGGGSGGGGFGGGGGGGTPGSGTPVGGGTPPGLTVPPVVPPIVTPVPIHSGGNGSGTPEPAAWLLMLTGFGAVGVAVRSRRVAVAARI